MEPIDTLKYVSPFQAIRVALGKLGYQNLMQTMEPDLVGWCIEAQDYISKPRTFVVMEGDYEVRDNRIAVCPEWQMIDCVSFATNGSCCRGRPMTYVPSRNCGGMTTKNLKNTCQGSTQQFTLDTCFIHFIPELKNGTLVHIEALQRPFGADGYPMAREAAVTAIANYVCQMICIRFNDSRFPIFDRKWNTSCRTARADLNRLSNQMLQNVGILYHKGPTVSYAGYSSGRYVTLYN